MTLKILLNGSLGRMGQAIQSVAKENEVEIIYALDKDIPFPEKLEGVNVFIDFSLHEATLQLAQEAAKYGIPLLIGTTGHTSEERNVITALSDKIPIVWAGNYSVGVNLLFYLVDKAARILGDNFHPEVLELHHRHKIDAPSGTAERLLELICQGRGWEADSIRHGRSGITGERPDQQIGSHAIRGGDIVGEHTVFFCGPGERIELTHRATDRKIFAHGALRAAKWVVGKPAGLYNMEDVLGLNSLNA